MTSTLMPLAGLDRAGRDVLFNDARSANTWTDQPVTDDELRTIRDLAQWAPTAANSNPGRVLSCDRARAASDSCGT